MIKDYLTFRINGFIFLLTGRKRSHLPSFYLQKYTVVKIEHHFKKIHSKRRKNLT